jgi:tetratricopeptide (TPR) repeat protein
MRRIFLLFVCVSLCFSTLLTGQTYQDGVNSYKKANVAHMVNDKDGERKALEEAWQIFEKLAAANDSKSLIMYYLVSLKLEKKVSLQQQLNRYVKTEHPGYSTIETVTFLGEDKTLILVNIKRMANENEQKAKKFLEEARDYAAGKKYQEAMDKLLELEKLWDIDGIDMLKNKYQRLDKEKQSALIAKRAKNLTRQGLYRDAIKTVDGAVGLLEPSEIASLKGEIKKSWYQKVFNEAKIEYKNKNYSQAVSKCDEAYALLSTDEALKLKRKSQRKMKGTASGSFAFFADMAMIGAFNPGAMNYNWTGNSTSYVSLSDRNTITSEMVTEKEDQAKIGWGFSGGLMILFSPSFGISASISSFFKQEFNIESDYTFLWTWSDGRGSSDSEYFTDSGTMSAVPISFNLVAILKTSGSGSLNLYAGPTLFLTNVDLNTHIGYGGVALMSDNYYRVDWFPFEYQIKKSESIFGGNVGADFEFKTRKTASFYMGFQYFFAPAKEFDWDLIVRRYDGEFGNLSIPDPSQLNNMPDYKSKIKLSTFKINFGIKFYF